MKIVRNPESGASGGGGGATPTPDSGNQNHNTNTGMVSREDHQRALDDMHKFKGLVGELQTKLKSLETKGLETDGQYKTLWEQAKQDLETERQKTTNILKTSMNTHRFNEVKVEALKQGLRPEAVSDLEMIDLEKLVPVEVTSSGRFIAQNVKETVEKLKSGRGHWFTAPQAPRVNAGGGAPPAGSGTPAKVGVKEMTQAELDLRHGKITKAKRDEIFQQYCKDNPRAGTVVVQATE